MGLRIIQGDGEGDAGTYTVLYCSTSMRALPWMFDSREEAELFLLEFGDVRRVSESEQVRMYGEWRKSRSARMSTITEGDRVQGGKPGTEDHDTGRVLRVHGDKAFVAWDSGVSTVADVAALALDAEAQCREHGCSRWRCDESH